MIYLAVNIVLAVCVWWDCQQRPLNPSIWALGTVLFGPLVVGLYLLKRPLKPAENRFNWLGWAGAAGFVLMLLPLQKETASTASNPAAAPQPQEKWRVSEKRNPMDGSTTVALSLDSETTAKGAVTTTRPRLVIRCKEKQTEVYIVTGGPASVEGDIPGALPDAHTVRTRFDDTPATEEWWYESSEHQALFAVGGSEYAKRLARARQFTFEFTPFSASPQVVSFDLSNLDSHLHRVADACRWSY